MRLGVIFVTGAAILALQLITSRVMTPYFGVSLYIWTSILSITLLFLALGYWIGGKVTHKTDLTGMALWYHSASAISALWIVISCLFYPHMFQPLALWDLVYGSFVACLFLLALPLFLLSALNPLLVALARDQAAAEHKPTDSGSGHVFFISTLGSVAGVLIAAFGIIPYATNYQAMLWIAVVLSLTSLTAIWVEEHLGKSDRAFITILALLALGLSGYYVLNKDTAGMGRLSLAKGDGWELVADVPSAFGPMKVVDWTRWRQKEELSMFERQELDKGNLKIEDLLVRIDQRLLIQNGILQNMYRQNSNESMTFFTYALQAAAHSVVPDAKTALVLGTGAGAVPREMADRGLDVDVVEIDPATIYAAKEYFQFDDTGIDIFMEDARTYVKRCDSQYDIIVVDLFHSTAGVPEHLVTREFFEDMKTCLTPEGGISVNFIKVRDYPEPFLTFLATVTDVFGETFAFYRSERRDAVNAFLAARRDGNVADTLADPVFLEEFGEVVPILNASFMPLGMVFEFKRSVSRTKQIYTPESEELAGYSALSDENNIWNMLSTRAQLAHQATIIKNIEPAMLVN